MRLINKVVKKSGSSFYWAMRLLPKEKREAMFTLYAFCRHIDDIVDDEGNISEKQELLSHWKDEIFDIYADKNPHSNFGMEIQKIIKRYNLPKNEFDKLLEAIAMDLPNPIQKPSIEKFIKYCEGVACAPGNLSLRIFGFTSEKIISELSYNLGIAMQITNILRDMKEDSLINRIYIPEEFIKKAEIEDEKPMQIVMHKNILIAREELGDLAEKYYLEAEKILSNLKNKKSKPVKIIYKIYKKYFSIMKERGWEIISPKQKVSKLYKLITALKIFLLK